MNGLALYIVVVLTLGLVQIIGVLIMAYGTNMPEKIKEEDHQELAIRIRADQFWACSGPECRASSHDRQWRMLTDKAQTEGGGGEGWICCVCHRPPIMMPIRERLLMEDSELAVTDWPEGRPENAPLSGPFRERKGGG